MNWLAATGSVCDILQITKSFNNDKWISVSQLSKAKSRDLQKLLSYFNWTTTSVSNLFKKTKSFSCYFCFILKRFTSRCLAVVYSIRNSIIFISSIIQFISVIILQTSWFHSIIPSVLKIVQIIQIVHWHENIKIFCNVNECVIDCWFVWHEWSIFFYHQLTFYIFDYFQQCFKQLLPLSQQQTHYYIHTNLVLAWGF